ncbi:MAG: hypothetical protein U0L09_07800 [Christensenellales bacterium]|jgi:vacuolar-type H+-ATPase subunit H|nr:hypothetical protein [Christensenellales bacterium]
MDRDQEKFYQEELSQQDAQPRMEEKPVDDMEFFIELLKHLRTVIERGSRVPLTNRVVIDADKCMMIIDDLENNLPDAVQYGMQMYSERKRIMGDAEETAISRVTSAEMRANAVLENARREAKQLVVDAEAEANAIIDDAQERADHMISENEITQQAREEARIIKNDARVEASELRLKVTHDAYQMLSALEEELVGACNSIRRRRMELGDDGE